MKSKEELLKIYSAYLPYELQGKSIYNESDDSQNEICTLSTKDDLNNFVGIDDWVNQYSYPIKPILYSMDMLTKEIEHKGERFIPIEKLTEINKDFKFGTTSDFYDNSDRLMFHFYNDHESEVSFSDAIKIYQKFLEWHLNIFGLSESEYIKKESLK